MAKSWALLLSVTILFIATCTNGFMETTMPNEYMICKPVAGVFGTLADGKNGSSGIMPVLQGPEGSPGPPGKTGLPGPKGKPDYSKVTSIVGEKMTAINARLFKLEQELEKLKSSGGSVSPGPGIPASTQSPEDIKNAKDCLEKYKSPISYGSMCYNIIGGDGLLWTFEAAESNCTKHGGNLADLNSRDVYDLIYNYIDKTYSTVVQAWTGMRYENDNLMKTDGKQANFVKWMAYNPRKSLSSYSSYYRSYTYVYANIDTSSRINGLQNSPSTRKLAYAICHYSLTGELPNTTMKTTTEADDSEDDDYY